mgnify:FL=1
MQTRPRAAQCHPERTQYASGMCRSCYSRDLARRHALGATFILRGTKGWKWSPEVSAKRAEALRRYWANQPPGSPHRRASAEGGRRGRQSAGRRTTCPEHYVRGFLDGLAVDYVFQHEIGDMLVDFFLPHHNLVLEVDGAYFHSLPGRQIKDVQREAKLAALGHGCVRLRCVGKNGLTQEARETLNALFRPSLTEGLSYQGAVG